MTLLSRARPTGLRFRLLALAPVVCGALALAPGADALTSPWTTCNATTNAQFQTCLNELGTTGSQVSNMIIVLDNKVYDPTQFETIPSGVNLEITGSGSTSVTGQQPAWKQSPGTLVGAPTINGVQLPTSGNDLDFFTIPATSNVTFKAVNLETGSTQGWSVIHDNGNLELDNVDFIGNNGSDVVLADDPTLGTPATATINNSNLSFGNGDAIETDTDSTATLYNTDVVGNQGGVYGNATLINTLVADNNTGSNGQHDCADTSFGFIVTATHSIDDDGSCVAAVGGAGNGVTTDSLTSLKLGSDAGNGGPTFSIPLKTGSPAIGAATSCLPADQRFYIRPSTSTCDVGAYQTGATVDTTTPVCPVSGSSGVVISQNASGIAQEAVTVTPTLEGIGLDSVTAYTLTTTGGFAPGTVSWNTVTGGPFAGATLWDETSPTAAQPDYNSLAPFTVTATKASSSDPSGDTKWSFPLTDWAGQTTICS